MPITVSDDGRLFALDSGPATYAFAIDGPLLKHLHWGGRVGRAQDFTLAPMWEISSNDPVVDMAAEEYPAQGGLRYKETCLAAQFADGSREIRLEPVGHEADADRLTIHLADRSHGLSVDLHYATLDEVGLLRRWATIRNDSGAPFLLTRAMSAQLHIPHHGLRFHNTHGQWGAELQPSSQTVGFAKLVVENRRGISSHNHTPTFILDRGAGEDAGEVWFGALSLTGNFRGVVEQRTYGGTSVQYGINDYEFRSRLEPGESLRTPALVFGYTSDGLSDMSARMHRHGRSLMTPGPRPVLYNSWEATGFEVTADNQLALAGHAARIGAELFVVDDGWFGRRDGTTDGLGDWWVNPEKFPDGLTPLIQGVRDLGMDFGLWLEPEMVNPAADLYRAHPDWIYSEPDAKPDLGRDQYVLDLGLDAVQDFIVESVGSLLDHNDISYIKWDANRPMAQVGSRTDAYWRHIEGLYRVVDRIKAKHPEVLIEACASGGGRVDYGALEHFDDFWTSDNTDGLDRLTIQETYSLLHPMKAMRAWVTDSPNFLTQRPIPLSFRFHAAMMGSLGIGADLTAFSEEELAESADLVQQYKQLRTTIQEGTFHRLLSAGAEYRAFQYVDADRSVLFAFLPATRIGRHPARVLLRGLEPDGIYRYRADWQDHEKSGAYLMEHGIPIWLLGDYASSLTVFDRIG